MWENKKINLGVIREKQEIKMHFKSLENIKDKIDFVRPCCGSCTDILSVNENGITAVFSSGIIPVHLKNIWEFEKCITVIYKDSSTDTLTFKGRVER